MYIGIKNIQALFKDCKTYLTSSDGMHCLTGWHRLSGAHQPYASYLLYVCKADELAAMQELPDDLHVLCMCEKEADPAQIAAHLPEGLSLLFVEGAGAETVYTRLQDYFNQQCGIGMFGQSMLEFLAFEGSLQDAVDYAYSVFRNPIYVFDTNFNLIAATWKQIEALNINDPVVVNKRFSESDYKMASRQGNLHSRILKSEIPIRAFNEELGYEQMYCAINTRKNLGHIVISAVNKPFYPIDSEFMLILKKYVDQQMKKDAFTRSARGFNYEYFLRDLLDEKISLEFGSKKHMQFVGSTFNGNMYCMVIETARSAAPVNITYVRNLIESRFPNCRILVYNDQIITIISFPDGQLMPDEYLDSGMKVCVENGLYAGISNCFQDILQLREFYSQALRAIEFGVEEKDDPALFSYADYYLPHITHMFLQKESARAFCHPKMAVLLDYDKDHHSELALTLYMYLTHERNLAATADAMEMHRTSLVYRFKKINALIGDDFDDYKDRLYLILSYEMNR